MHAKALKCTKTGTENVLLVYSGIAADNNNQGEEKAEQKQVYDVALVNHLL